MRTSALDDATTTCNTANPFLAVGADCTIGAVFAPSVAGNPLIANIDIGTAGDTANAPLDIQLVGDATSVNSTTTTVDVQPESIGIWTERDVYGNGEQQARGLGISPGP